MSGRVRPALHDPAFHAGDPFPTYRRLRPRRPSTGTDAGLLGGVAARGRDRGVARSGDVLLEPRDAAVRPRAADHAAAVDPLHRPARPREVPEARAAGVQPGTPARARELRSATRAPRCSTRFADARDVDFVEDFAVPLPMLVIAEMLGVPGSRPRAVQAVVGRRDRGGERGDAGEHGAGGELLTYFAGVLAERAGEAGRRHHLGARRVGDRRRAARGVRPAHVLHDAAGRGQRDDAQPALAGRARARETSRRDGSARAPTRR